MSSSVRAVSCAVVALMISGCAHRQASDEQATSIKDDTAAAVSERVAPVAAAHEFRHTRVEPTRKMPTRIASAQRADVSPYDVPRVSRLKGPEPAASVPATTVVPKMPARTAVSPPPAPVQKHAALVEPKPPTPEKPVTAPPAAPQRPAPITSVAPANPPPAAPAAEPKVELIPAPKAPIAAAPVTPPVTPPPADAANGGRPATSKAPVPVTPPSAAATTPATPQNDKVASLGAPITTRDALDRADALLKSGQIINARALLQDAARGESPELLAALAATYDPIVLVDYPAVQKSADAKRAAELYEIAIGKGSVAARERLAKLKVYMSRQGN